MSTYDWDNPMPNIDRYLVGFVAALDLFNRRMSMLTTAMAGVAFVGDHLRLSIDSNRIRRLVDAMYDRHHLGITTYVRPSRGWRRHVRRVKAEERRGRR